MRSQEWWLQALHVTQAWQQSTRGRGVTVAVLDTGVNPSQADLARAVVTGPDYSDSGRVRGGPFWGIRGTAMASLIAGRGHGPGQAGIIGIAPAATILSVRVTLEGNDPLLADANIAAGLPGAIARGIRYAVRHHATVIDLPLDPVTTSGAPGAGGSAEERAAVAYALAHRVVLVAPAGDDGDGADAVNFPAAYRGVISVGAFNSAFAKASFSSRQPYVTLTAAGDGVIAANTPRGYTPVNSTAAASAVVAGIVALIRAQFPALSPAQVTTALTESTVFRPAGGQKDGSGAGTVDAAKALAAAARTTEAVPTSSPAGVAPAAQPPSPPAVHTSGGLGKTLFIDLGIAAAVFLVLAVPILGYGRHRRRRARAARLAEVRAAAQPVARRPQQAQAAPAGQASTPPTRHASIATPEPEEYSYIPAPLSPEDTVATSPPVNGAGPSAKPPWAPWGNESGSPGSGSPGGAFPGSAFPMTGHPGAQAAPAGLADWAEQAGAAETSSAPGPAFRGGRMAHAGPAHAGPAHAGPGQGGGAPGGNTTGDGTGTEAGPAAPGPAAGRLAGSHRVGVPRTPKVSGSPPWEPAPEPAGEVPWGRSSMPPAGGTRAFPTGGQAQAPAPEALASGPPEPETSSWDEIAEQAWPGGPRASRPPAPPSRGRGSANGGRARDATGDLFDDDPATGSQPIYVWDPGAPSDSFPVIPPGENHEP